MNNLTQIAKQTRQLIIKSIYESGGAHPGGSLSVVEILTCLYATEMQPRPYYPYLPDRDRLILSGGHKAPALYALWAALGWVEEAKIMGLRKLGSPYQGHPSLQHTPWCEASTGSLGQGFSVAGGMALGFKLQQKPYRVYVVCGEGDLHEGQTSEGARFAGHNKLNNLVCILDHNKHQSDAASQLLINPVDEFRAMGWHAKECDGHEFRELETLLDFARHKSSKPVLIVAHTVKGRGVSFMEDRPEYHGSLTLSDEELKQALADLR